MELVPARLEAEYDGLVAIAGLSGSGDVQVGPLNVTLEPTDRWPRFTWAVANRSDLVVRIRSVTLIFGVVDVVEPLRMFRNGYQSWSPAGVATFGIDVDPSSIARFEFLQAVHHADQRVVASPGELRSEWVTLLADARGALALIGFAAGTEHDGTLRLVRSSDGNGIELRAEAFLGDAHVGPNEERILHGVHIDEGDGAPAEMLDRWAVSVGTVGQARVDAPYQVGWCSWYHYFSEVNEETLLANLALAGNWPFGVFQLDDGYQSAIGDWLDTNEKFPSGLATIAERIAAAGCRPGLWLAPFLAAPDSLLARQHPDWLAGHTRSDGTTGPLYPWWNPTWGGGQGGLMRGLDTTHPEVLAHLETTARMLIGLGFTYLKLDFTFAPSVDGVWADPTRTPAQRVRAGFEAIRRGAGDEAFILGCGVPLSHVVGLVDGNRIGQDVAPLWRLQPSDEIVPGYLAVQPATAHAYGNTVARSFMHRRLWLNDPDCLMLRTSRTALTPDAAQTWAQVVAVSGGMALVSDDLALLDASARRLLDETLVLGRTSDEAARTGPPAAAVDLMERCPPTVFTSVGGTVVTDPATGSSTLRSP